MGLAYSLSCGPRGAVRCKGRRLGAGLGAAIVLLLALMFDAGAEAEEEPLPSAESEVAQRDFDFAIPRFTVGFRLGYLFNRSEGGIYDFLTQQLTLDSSDFDGGVLEIDFAIRLLSRADLVFGVGFSEAEASSEYRDYVDESDEAIRQKTRLSQVPLTVSLRLYPLERWKRIGEHAYIQPRFTPYLGAGMGATWYELKQKGSFVDFRDLTVFRDTFITDGWAFSGHVFAGVDIKVLRRVGLVIEGRYSWAEADVRGSFVGFEPINLDGARVTAGIAFRF